MTVRVLPVGDAGVLVEVPSLPDVLALAAAVRTAGLPGVVDVVPAARTVLLLAPGVDPARLGDAVRALTVDPSAELPDGGTVDLPVVYDGPDLDEVGRLTGLGADGVVEAHTATPWRVAFGGFAPGFAYLVGGALPAVPRRSEPRTTVPAGAVGLAGEYSGVYPRPSPGGWQLIGRTATTLWDAHRTPPALLTPGTRVRFHRTPEPERGPDRPSDRVPAPRCGRVVEVTRVGGVVTVQDAGRPGHRDVGVGAAGAADRGACALANRLVANPPGAAALEVVFGGLGLRAGDDLAAPLLVALTGAPAPATVDGRPVGHHALVVLRAGQELRLGAPPSGLRTYLAVRGGIDAPAELGSRSTDTLSGLGPAPLRPGDVLAVGPEPRDLPLVDVAPVAVPGDGPVVLRAVPGPRADWAADLRDLERTGWTASARGDRVGVRLEGGPLRRLDRGELPSEGLVRGAVQVPPGGEPVLFGADHPVTGGYPVVAVVRDADLDRAAQLRPGQPVRFRLETR